ncbi:hypothetical protein C1I92_13395 [Jiangella anatolica]|uniref:Uncharacterized protein n=1 Tax=Jiangella anatolica TaxID=2670374 RepID=A0A2W2CST1_9ACTN|nr:hypothetical protein C1I92_13395 [Jiangella anatolica]
MVVAMLAIVMVATAVLAAVGVYYHLSESAAVRRRLRRWRFLVVARLDDWRAATFHRLRIVRRGLARRLARPAPAPSAAVSRIGGTSEVTHRAA